MHPCRVDVWTIALDEPRDILLSPDEQVRANRFRFEHDRVHWTRAHSALRAILSRYLNAPPLTLSFRVGPHGKPAVEVRSGEPGIEFNLSHSANRAMIAVSACAPVGIDLERVREDVEMDKLLRRIGETQLTGSPKELFQVWARREARTKAIGGPLMEIPSEDLRVADLIAPEGFVAALALVAHDAEVHYCGGGV